jgi:phosphatidylserine/phosphatidylglycerophosphate/cardiolipin synthase-like enzyme
MSSSQDTPNQQQDTYSIQRARAKQLEDELNTLRARGVRVPVIQGSDSKLEERLIKLAAIAKRVARTEICVRVIRNGEFINLSEPIGHEEQILQTLLMRAPLRDETEGVTP